VDRRVHWRFTWRQSRLVRWAGTTAGGAGLGLVVAALLARADAPLVAGGTALAVATVCAAVLSVRLVRQGRVRTGAAARVAAAAAPVALALYALALRGQVVAVLAVAATLQVALAAGTFATALRSVGTVDPGAETLSYGTSDSQVTVDLTDADAAYALSFRHRALLVLRWERSRPLDPARPSLVVVSRDAATLTRRIVRS